MRINAELKVGNGAVVIELDGKEAIKVNYLNLLESGAKASSNKVDDIVVKAASTVLKKVKYAKKLTVGDEKGGIVKTKKTDPVKKVAKAPAAKKKSAAKKK